MNAYQDLQPSEHKYTFALHPVFLLSPSTLEQLPRMAVKISVCGHVKTRKGAKEWARGKCEYKNLRMEMEIKARVADMSSQTSHHVDHPWEIGFFFHWKMGLEFEQLLSLLSCMMSLPDPLKLTRKVSLRKSKSLWRQHSDYKANLLADKISSFYFLRSWLSSSGEPSLVCAEHVIISFQHADLGSWDELIFWQTRLVCLACSLTDVSPSQPVKDL